eukprot:TRINITY_DN20297_c0_g1_i1.p1 TRINITY_DN20297_c0_g1~~TRINITY_DN20297_c0_g1_i1.p1  ORF type:complete len:779 (-),score=167.54 TRINITY_DN20297_c0_g1_i1:193-2529(-)
MAAVGGIDLADVEQDSVSDLSPIPTCASVQSLEDSVGDFAVSPRRDTLSSTSVQVALKSTRANLRRLHADFAASNTQAQKKRLDLSQRLTSLYKGHTVAGNLWDGPVASGRLRQGQVGLKVGEEQIHVEASARLASQPYATVEKANIQRVTQPDDFAKDAIRPSASLPNVSADKANFRPTSQPNVWAEKTRPRRASLPTVLAEKPSLANSVVKTSLANPHAETGSLEHALAEKDRALSDLCQELEGAQILRAQLFAARSELAREVAKSRRWEVATASTAMIAATAAVAAFAAAHDGLGIDSAALSAAAMAASDYCCHDDQAAMMTAVAAKAAATAVERFFHSGSGGSGRSANLDSADPNVATVSAQVSATSLVSAEVDALKTHRLRNVTMPRSVAAVELAHEEEVEGVLEEKSNRRACASETLPARSLTPHEKLAGLERHTSIALPTEDFAVEEHQEEQRAEQEVAQRLHRQLARIDEESAQEAEEERRGEVAEDGEAEDRRDNDADRGVSMPEVGRNEAEKAHQEENQEWEEETESVGEEKPKQDVMNELTLVLSQATASTSTESIVVGEEACLDACEESKDEQCPSAQAERSEDGEGGVQDKIDEGQEDRRDVKEGAQEEESFEQMAQADRACQRDEERQERQLQSAANNGSTTNKVEVYDLDRDDREDTRPAIPVLEVQLDEHDVAENSEPEACSGQLEVLAWEPEFEAVPSFDLAGGEPQWDIEEEYSFSWDGGVAAARPIQNSLPRVSDIARLLQNTNQMASDTVSVLDAPEA